MGQLSFYQERYKKIKENLENRNKTSFFERDIRDVGWQSVSMYLMQPIWDNF